MQDNNMQDNLSFDTAIDRLNAAIARVNVAIDQLIAGEITSEEYLEIVDENQEDLEFQKYLESLDS